MRASQVNKGECLLNGTGYRFLNEDMDTPIKQIGSYWKVQMGRNDHCYQVGMSLFNHQTIICVSYDIKATCRIFQGSPVDICYANNLNNLLIEVSEYAQVIHTH